MVSLSSADILNRLQGLQLCSTFFRLVSNIAIYQKRTITRLELQQPLNSLDLHTPANLLVLRIYSQSRWFLYPVQIYWTGYKDYSDVALSLAIWPVSQGVVAYENKANSAQLD